MDGTKLGLSEQERRMVQDPGIILTKNAIISKVYAMFGSLAEGISTGWPGGSESAGPSPKISKGENYEGLPWVVLDFPRLYSVKDILAIRYFFWWGNFFSVTLHLRGKYRQAYAGRIVEQYATLAAGNYHIAVNEDEWQHHYGEDNYRAVQDLTPDAFAEICRQHPFLKISRKFVLTRWDEMPDLLRNTGMEMIGWLGVPGSVSQPVE